MQWLLDNLVTIFVTVSGALSVMVGFLWNLDRRTRENTREITGLKEGIEEAKSARVELHGTVQELRKETRKVGEDVSFIRGLLSQDKE